MICRDDSISRAFHHRMWGMKLWEDFQISDLGGDAAKQDTGKRAGLGWTVSLEEAVLS